MIRLDVLNQSGLFDLAYDGGEHEDGDLGMRIYLSGALMVLNPSVSVLHHHAPSGGLRTHKARVVTYVSSRQSLTRRRLPSVSDLYLAGRYFSPRQVREMIWQSALGTFAVRGGPGRKALKLLIGLIYLPNTLWRIRKRSRQAENMRKVFPKIPSLASPRAVGEEILR
jgi:hypothetical protein